VFFYDAVGPTVRSRIWGDLRMDAPPPAGKLTGGVDSFVGGSLQVFGIKLGTKESQRDFGTLEIPLFSSD
jgi:hypothetical protein